MKTYKGHALRNRRQPCITVEQNGKVTPFTPDRSLRLRNHSPTGFEWGYSGSGPAQLALALLLDHTNDSQVAEERYQQFKCAVVARMPPDCWELTSAEIDMFLHAGTNAAIEYFKQKFDGHGEVPRT